MRQSLPELPPCRVSLSQLAAGRGRLGHGKVRDGSGRAWLAPALEQRTQPLPVTLRSWASTKRPVLSPIDGERSPEAARVTATRGFCPGCDREKDGDVPPVLPGLCVHLCGMLSLLRFGTRSQPAVSCSWAATSPLEKGAGEGDTQTWWGGRSWGSNWAIWGAGVQKQVG